MDDKLTEEKAIAKLIVGYGNKRINIMEKAQAVRFLYEIYQSAEEVSRRTTIEPTTISRYLRISYLPDSVKKLVREGKLSSYHVLAELDRIKGKDKMVSIAKNITDLPRELSREIIRYCIKHQELSAKEAIKYVIDSYGETYEVFAYFIFLDENENNVDNIKNLKIDKELTNLRKNLKIVPFEDYYIAIMEEET
ncbi:MAG: hypothetical protein ACOC5T_04780, partial [Elusimicrobiota bacterium]